MPTPWQLEVRTRIDGLLARKGHRATWVIVPVRPDPLVGHAAGDTYLKAEFGIGGLPFEVYVYTDEAGVAFAGTWHVFELADWMHEPRLACEALLRFLDERIG